MSTEGVLALMAAVFAVVMTVFGGRHQHGYDGLDADGEPTGCLGCRRKREESAAKAIEKVWSGEAFGTRGVRCKANL
jgi:hypothetical protein